MSALPCPCKADEKPTGFLEYQARQNIRDLCRVYGWAGAREIIAEIINSEAERTAPK